MTQVKASSSDVRGTQSTFTTIVNPTDGSLSQVRSDEDLGLGQVIFLEIVASVDSLFALKRWIRVAWKPRKWAVHPPPPYYAKKLLPIPTLKPRRLNQGDKSWKFAQEKHAWLLRKITLLNLKIEFANNIRRRKFLRREKNYLRLMKLQETGYDKYTRSVRLCNVDLLPDNGYMRTRTTDFGWSTNVSRRDCDVEALPGWWLFPDWTAGAKPYSFTQNNGYFKRKLTTYADHLGTLTNVGEDDQSSDKNRSNRKALDKLFSKIKNQDVSLGEMTGERHQSWMMLKELLSKIAVILKASPSSLAKYKLAHSVKSKSGLLGHVSKEASNDFLMWTYGIQPLMHDIQAILGRISNVTDRSQYVVVRAHNSQNHTRTYDTPEIDSLGHWIVRQTKLISSVSTSYVVRYRVTNPVLVNLSQLGLTSPLEIGYELSKFSFLIDWFYNLGQYIDQLSAFQGLEFESGTKVTVAKRFYDRTWFEAIDAQATNGQYEVLQVDTRAKAIEEKSREVLTSAPTPLLPEFKSPLSVYHLEVAIALIIQRLK